MGVSKRSVIGAQSLLGRTADTLEVCGEMRVNLFIALLSPRLG